MEFSSLYRILYKKLIHTNFYNMFFEIFLYHNEIIYNLFTVSLYWVSKHASNSSSISKSGILNKLIDQLPVKYPQIQILWTKYIVKQNTCSRYDQGNDKLDLARKNHNNPVWWTPWSRK